MELIEKYQGVLDNLLIEHKDKEKCMENGTFIKSVECKFQLLNLEYNYSLMDIHNYINSSIRNSELVEFYREDFSKDLKLKYFLTNYRFNSFDLFLKIVKYVEIHYGGQRINRVYTFLDEGDPEVFMKKYFSNLFLCEYHKLEYKFYFIEGVQIKDICDLVFSFDVYKVNNNFDLKKIEYKFPQIQYHNEVYNLNEVMKIRLRYNHPGKELIIKINNDGGNDLTEIMKEILFVFDHNEFKLKLSRNYKNLYIYDIVENFGKTINFSKIDYGYVKILPDNRNIELEICLISYNLIRFLAGMSGLGF